MSFTDQEFAEWAAKYAKRFGFDTDGKVMVAGWITTVRAKGCTLDELNQARRVVEASPPAFWREHDHAFFGVLSGIVWSRNTRNDAERRRDAEQAAPPGTQAEWRAIAGKSGWWKPKPEATKATA